MYINIYYLHEKLVEMEFSKRDIEAAIQASLQTAQEDEDLRKATKASLLDLTNPEPKPRPDTSNDEAIAKAMSFGDIPVQTTQSSRDARQEMRDKCRQARMNAKVVPASQAMMEHEQSRFYIEEIRRNCRCNNKPPKGCQNNVGWWLGEMNRVVRGCQKCMFNLLN